MRTAIRKHLLDVQFGRLPDTHNWLHPVVAAQARTADAQYPAPASR